MCVHKGGKGDPSFGISDGTIEVKENITFENRPSEMIRLFSLAIDSNLVVGRRTADLVAECAATGLHLREDPEAAACFLQVLVDPRDAGTPSRFGADARSGTHQRAHSGVGATGGPSYSTTSITYIRGPALALCGGHLEGHRTGEIAADYPQVSAEFPSVTRRLALFVAVLLP